MQSCRMEDQGHLCGAGPQPHEYPEAQPIDAAWRSTCRPHGRLGARVRTRGGAGNIPLREEKG